MPIVLAKCTECGGTIKVDSEKKLDVCENRGEPFVVEEAINNFTNYYTKDEFIKYFNEPSKRCCNDSWWLRTSAPNNGNADFVYESGTIGSAIGITCTEGPYGGKDFHFTEHGIRPVIWVNTEKFLALK